MWQMPMRFDPAGRSGFDAEDDPYRGVVDLNAFDESSDEIAFGRPVRAIQPLPDFVGKQAQFPDYQL